MRVGTDLIFLNTSGIRRITEWKEDLSAGFKTADTGQFYIPIPRAVRYWRGKKMVYRTISFRY